MGTVTDEDAAIQNIWKSEFVGENSAMQDETKIKHATDELAYDRFFAKVGNIM